MTKTLSNSDRFINAFSTLENEMNRRIKSDRYISYSELVRRMSTLDKGYHRYQRYLEEFGDLRNAIVHERIDGEVIAEPHLKVVEMIEQIAQILTKPESVSAYFQRKVEYAYEDELIRDVINKMAPHHYSKLPIYSRKLEFRGLLTTDAIAYYMVEHLDQIQCNLPSVSISEVMKFDEKGREVGFLPIHANLITVVNEFERSLTSGKRLNALIITQDGASNQKPLGIISISDLPMIYEKLNKNLL